MTSSIVSTVEELNQFFKCSTTVSSFAGIELDTCALEARLLHDKLKKYRFIAQEFLKRKKVSLK